MLLLRRLRSDVYKFSMQKRVGRTPAFRRVLALSRDVNEKAMKVTIKTTTVKLPLQINVT